MGSGRDRVTAAESPPAPDDERGRRVVIGVAFVAVAIPLVVAMVVLLAGPSFEHYSDTALIELRTLDVGHHTTLLGPYSRFTWRHPGPFLFLLLAGPYRLAGSNAQALGFASLLVGVVALSVAMLATWRGRPSLTITIAAVVLILQQNLGVGTFIDPWNPWITLLPLVAFVVLCWGAGEGSLLALPGIAIVGTFLVQSHLEYAPLVAVGLIAAGFGVWRHRLDAQPSVRARRAALGSALLVALVLWTPPLLDEFNGSGNLSTIVRYFTESGHTVGLEIGYGAVAQQLSLNANWLRGLDFNHSFGFVYNLQHKSPAVPYALIPFAVALWYAARRRWHDIVRFGVLVIAMTVVSVFSISSIRGDLGEYLVRWTWILGALVVAVPGWVIARLLTRDRVRPALVLALLGVAAGAWVAWGFAQEIPPRTPTLEPPPAEVRQLVQPLIEEVSRGTTVRLEANPPAAWIFLLPTLAVDLERHGVHVAVPQDLADEFGQFRANRQAQVRVQVVAGGDIEQLRRRRDLRIISITDGAPQIALFQTVSDKGRPAAPRAK